MDGSNKPYRISVQRDSENEKNDPISRIEKLISNNDEQLLLTEKGVRQNKPRKMARRNSCDVGQVLKFSQDFRNTMQGAENLSEIPPNVTKQLDRSALNYLTQLQFNRRQRERRSSVIGSQQQLHQMENKKQTSSQLVIANSENKSNLSSGSKTPWRYKERIMQLGYIPENFNSPTTDKTNWGDKLGSIVSKNLDDPRSDPYYQSVLTQKIRSKQELEAANVLARMTADVMHPTTTATTASSNHATTISMAPPTTIPKKNALNNNTLSVPQINQQQNLNNHLIQAQLQLLASSKFNSSQINLPSQVDSITAIQRLTRQLNPQIFMDSVSPKVQNTNNNNNSNINFLLQNNKVPNIVSSLLTTTSTTILPTIQTATTTESQHNINQQVLLQSNAIDRL